MGDVGSDFNRQALRWSAYCICEFLVGLVVYEEHGGLGDFGGPPVQLEAVELANREPLFPLNVEGHAGLAAPLADSHDDVGLDAA